MTGRGAGRPAWTLRRAGCTALSLHPLRTRLAGRAVPTELHGISEIHHIALTFDDGPDPASTPHVLEELDRHGLRATFFLLGAHVAPAVGVVRELVSSGHELAVHGWDHRATPLVRGDRLADQLRRARDVVEDAGGQRVEWYRPPYGALSPTTFRAAEAAGLRTVLWSAWGRDWERRATSASVHRTLDRTLEPGGTVLLHDTDRTSAPDSWRVTLTALPLLAQTSPAPLGPLRDHGLDR
jgi:peptidoglycan/xylan/chitin deacetylase (PgdA/CDA1 family)